MQEKSRSKNFSFPYLFDEGQKLTNLYGARVTPHIFLLKKEGSGYKVVYTGAIDNDTQNVNLDKTKYVENAIVALQAGKTPEPASTKAIGCTVKRATVETSTWPASFSCTITLQGNMAPILSSANKAL